MSRVRSIDRIAQAAAFALLVSAPMAFGQDPGGPPSVAPPQTAPAVAPVVAPVAAAPAVAPDHKQLVADITNAIGPRLAHIEDAVTKLKNDVDGLKQKSMNFTVKGDFLTRGQACASLNVAPPQPGAAQPCQPDATGGKPGGKDHNCKTTWVATTRLSTTWVDSYKRVTITKPTPYIEVCNEWDPRSCCWRQTYVTKYRQEEQEIVVPYKQEVIQEVPGIEQITVCLDDIK